MNRFSEHEFAKCKLCSKQLTNMEYDMVGTICTDCRRMSTAIKHKNVYEGD